MDDKGPRTWDLFVKVHLGPSQHGARDQQQAPVKVFSLLPNLQLKFSSGVARRLWLEGAGQSTKRGNWRMTREGDGSGFYKAGNETRHEKIKELHYPRELPVGHCRVRKSRMGQAGSTKTERETQRATRRKSVLALARPPKAAPNTQQQGGAMRSGRQPRGLRMSLPSSIKPRHQTSGRRLRAGQPV